MYPNAMQILHKVFIIRPMQIYVFPTKNLSRQVRKVDSVDSICFIIPLRAHKVTEYEDLVHRRRCRCSRGPSFHFNKHGNAWVDPLGELRLHIANGSQANSPGHSMACCRCSILVITFNAPTGCTISRNRWPLLPTNTDSRRISQNALWCNVVTPCVCFDFNNTRSYWKGPLSVGKARFY